MHLCMYFIGVISYKRGKFSRLYKCELSYFKIVVYSYFMYGKYHIITCETSGKLLKILSTYDIIMNLPVRRYIQ